MTGPTTLERVETAHRYLTGSAGDAGSANEWPEVVDDWAAFRSDFAEGDEIWEFGNMPAEGAPRSPRTYLASPRAISDHQQGNQSYMEEGVMLLELANRAVELFEKQEPREKRRLLD